MSISIAHTYIDELDGVAKRDVAEVKEKDAAYGGSWKKRGGVGAFMMLARKVDRLEQSAEKYGWDIFKAIDEDPREESVLDDIRDLRRYLLLIEAEMTARNTMKDRARAVDNYRPCIDLNGYPAWHNDHPTTPQEWTGTPVPTVTTSTLPELKLAKGVWLGEEYLRGCPCGDGDRPGHPDGWCTKESLSGA